MNTLSKYVCAAPLFLSFSMATAQTVPGLPSSTTNGSGGTPTLAAASNPAAGYYTGELSDGSRITAYVLEDGEFWITQLDKTRTDAEARFLGVAVVQGSMVANNGTITSNNVVALGTNPPFRYSLSASYMEKSAITGTLLQEGSSVPLTFSAVYFESYDQPYPIEVVTNSYDGTMQLQDETQRFSFHMSINEDGTLAGRGEDIGSDCFFRGEARQISPTNNPYYVTLTFGGALCPVANETLTGVMNAAEHDGPGELVSIVFVGNNINRDKLLQFAAVPVTPFPSIPHVDLINE